MRRTDPEDRPEQSAMGRIGFVGDQAAGETKIGRKRIDRVENVAATIRAVEPDHSGGFLG